MTDLKTRSCDQCDVDTTTELYPSLLFSSIPEKQVLVVHSPHSTNQRSIKSFVCKLHTHPHIKPTCYRPDVTAGDWIHQEYPRADLVVCICDEQFALDWERDQGQIECKSCVSSLLFQVYSCQEYFSYNIKPIVVVLPGEEDSKFIPEILASKQRFTFDETATFIDFINNYNSID